ncbi:SIS domain-containing protein [bacterium]|nr:SIS domain-containing protein [bacterium]
MIDIVRRNFEESAQLMGSLSDEDFLERVSQAAEKIVGAIDSGGKVIVAGNGGSAADAQHFVAELVGRFQRERHGFPAVAITTNTSVLTALANDYSFEKVFSRQIEALARPGDVFVGISTSGNSPNIVSAFETAKSLGIFSIGLLGKGGGKCAGMCDLPIIVPHNKTARIQEAHILIIHAICDAVETTLAGE